MNQHCLSVQSILDWFNRAVQDDHFPMMDNLNYPIISGRVDVYRSEQAWAVVFNVLALSAEGITTMVDPIGPQVKMVAWNDYIADHTAQMAEKMQQIEGVCGG